MLPKIPTQGLTGDVLLREAVTEFREIIGLVRKALGAKLYPTQQDSWVSIEAIYPDKVICCANDKTWQFPYTIDASNQVTLGDPVEVREEYVPIKEALANLNPGESVFIEAQGAAGGKWLIRVIKAGVSGNNNFYPDATLREAVPLFNGARVFVKSDAEHIKGDGKAFNQLAGGLSDAVFVEGKSPDSGEIHAVLTFIEPEGAVAVKVREAFDRGLANLFGFSIDAVATAKSVVREGKKVRQAGKITKVESVDLIVEPGAGGQLIRMVESINPEKEQDMSLRLRMLEAIQQKNPAKFAGMKPEDIADDELETAYREAVAVAPGQKTDSLDVAEVMRMVEARDYARDSIADSTLPPAAKDKLKAHFKALDRFTEADVTSAIKAEGEYLAKFTESGKVSLPFDSVRVEDTSVQIADMLDAFFDPEHKNHRQVGSFKECYIRVTGDREVTGKLRDCDMSRLREAAGASFREAVDSSTWAQVLGDAITRRLQAIYVGMTDYQSWRKVANVGRTSDFRLQHVTRIGGYGNLSVVPEGDPYPELNDPGDDESTWQVAKRGGTASVTYEAIKNDDVRAISRIPLEMAQAAGSTLYEFAFDFFRTNPNAWDGVALYHASHGNLFSAALDAAAFKAHRMAMQKMTRSGSGKRLATSPKYLLVPFDLQDTAYDLFVRGTNNDKTFIQSLNPEIITVDYWTDATDWVTVADPSRFGVLEIDFLDGREEPEMFVQDNPTAGSLFTHDKITYKIRHIYGGGLLVDAEKGTTKAVVAG